MNKLLKRQIRKTIGDNDKLSEDWATLLNLISDTYDECDNDRKLIEHTLEITSEEMILLNNKLRQESKKALDLADERLKHATRSSNVGIWEHDLITNEVIWNETTYSLYGLKSCAELNGAEAWQKYVHPEDQIIANDKMEQAINNGKEFDMEYRVVWPDESVRHLRVKGMTETDLTGKVIKIVGTKWDITEKKIAQDNIKREKDLADSVINSLPGIFFLFTLDGKLLRWNKNLVELTGYTSEEIANMHPLDFFDENEKEHIKNEIGIVLTNGRSDTEAHLLTKNKEKLPYFFNSIKISYEGQDCIIGTTMDIAKRIKVETNLKVKNKDLEEFAYIVSHNLRAPIAKIQGLATLINPQESASKENLNLLNYIKDEVVNLDVIIKEMNSIIREKDYINFNVSVMRSEKSSLKVKNIYLIDDDAIVNIISKKTFEKSGIDAKLNVHQNAIKALEELKILSEIDMNNFPEMIFLDINMPEMNGWEFLDGFENFTAEVKKNCSVYMLTSSIDPSDIKRSYTYKTVKDFISKPLTKDKLKKLFT